MAGPHGDVSLEAIRTALKGVNRALSPGEALGLLSPDRFPEAIAVLAEVIEAPEVHTPLRSGAAIALGRIDDKDSERVLLRNLDRTPEPVRAEILRSLGQIGSRDALPAVLQARTTAQGPTAQMARFASVLMSCRLHVDVGDWPEVSPADVLAIPPGQRVVVTADPPTPDRARKVFSDLARFPYAGVRLSTENMVELRCRRQTNVLCLNQEVSNSDSAALLSKSRTLLGVVALESPESGEFSVSFVVLVSPVNDGSIRLLASRCSGRLALVGVGRRTKEGFDLALRSVIRPGALPIELEAALNGGRLEVVSAAVGVVRGPARILRAGVPPRLLTRQETESPPDID